MKFNPEIFGSTIVAVGSFNPAIFTPDWLLSSGLIGANDRDAALASDGLVITKQVSAFETDWFGIQVLDDRFTLASKGVLTPALRDLAQGVFELVPHTPVTAVGLNFHGHYAVGSEERHHRVGDALAPKDVWRKALPGQWNLGLADLQIYAQPGKRGEPLASADRVTMQVQPSSKVKLGVFLSMNDHRADLFKGGNKSGNAQTAANVVHADWDKTWSDAIQSFETLLLSVLAED